MHVLCVCAERRDALFARLRTHTRTHKQREWKEHWCYVLQGARSLAADIERFEDELNKLTARKRMVCMVTFFWPLHVVCSFVCDGESKTNERLLAMLTDTKDVHETVWEGTFVCFALCRVQIRSRFF
jgi:hypothetical protein